MPAPKPAKVRLPVDLFMDLQEQAKSEDRSPHRLSLLLIAEGIERREMARKINTKNEVTNGVFA
jgi:hypothetical protein